MGNPAETFVVDRSITEYRWTEAGKRVVARLEPTKHISGRRHKPSLAAEKQAQAGE
jgi:hypothetical protein